MLCAVKIHNNKPVHLLKAGEAMTRGACVVRDFTDDTVDKATAANGFGFVDAVANYEGINAVKEPNDAAFEAIASGAVVTWTPAEVGERYATTELTIGEITKGDYLKASAGKFVAGATNDVCEWVYGGTYTNPWGLTMYIVEKVEQKTITA